MNGLVGMKPSLVRVSGKGIVPLIRFQDTAGPIARCVTDLAILLSAMESTPENLIAGLGDDKLKGVKAGVLRADISADGVTGRKASALERIDEGLKASGAVTVDLDPLGRIELLPVILLGLAMETVPYLRDAGAPVDSLFELKDYNEKNPSRRIPRGQNMLELACGFYEESFLARGMGDEEVRKIYENVAIEAGQSARSILDRLFAESGVELIVSLNNIHSVAYATAGYPAITVPLGLDSEGEPDGVTFIGKSGEDARLLGYAYAFEAATRWRSEPILTD